uniref:peptidoglycan-recognition protein SC2-like n=1 Tax=Myxine glutinosa TaxID=7769 RepID=UPI0035900BFA
MIFMIFLSVFFLPFAHLETILREDWGGEYPARRAPMTTPVQYFVIHHTATGRCFNRRACSKIVRTIQNYHMKHRGWSDIGYNFLVGEDGNVYEGRGWRTVGAHAPGYNSKSIGLSFIGNFSSKKPNQKALTAAKELIRYAINHNKLKMNYKLIGHRQTKMTDCPGTALYKEISTWPNWVKRL